VKAFVVGSGGREESISWKLKNEGIKDIYKISSYLYNIDHGTSEDLVIVGPEAPIAEGLVDELESKNVPVFGPTKFAGRLETSKLWAKQFMQRHDIPTSNFRLFKRENLKTLPPPMPTTPTLTGNSGYPIVIKEDVLCGGKGVVVCKNRSEAETALTENYSINKFNSSSDNVLIEDFVEGVEASCFVLTDGKDYKILPYCQDHKPVGEGNTGPNTGGMGAFCPTSRITEKLKKRIEKEIVIPTLNGMREEKSPYKGVLYVGLMIKKDGSPYVIEYNVRFGDPECQVLMMLLKSELYPLLKSVADGTLGEQPDPEFHDGFALTVVMCSGGYPNKYEKGYEIDWKERTYFSTPNMQVFHAGTKWKGDRYVTDGGRVLNITAKGSSLEVARKRAYETVERINWKNSFYRRDIGLN
jgi:phosphoribosylamine--glycine ligase